MPDCDESAGGELATIMNATGIQPKLQRPESLRDTRFNETYLFGNRQKIHALIDKLEQDRHACWRHGMRHINWRTYYQEFFI